MYAIVTNLGVVGALKATNAAIADIFTAVEIPAGSTAAVGDLATCDASGNWTFAGAPAPTPAQLIAYAEAKRAAIAAGGISVNIAAAGASPQMVEVGTDTGGLALLANAVQLTSTAPGTIYDWDQDAPVTITGAQILSIQAAVGLFNQELFSLKTAIRAAINAGTITAIAQIDDPTTVALAAWPVNS